MSTINQKFTAAELVPGQTYCVIQNFIDYDGIVHPIGECWRFTAKNFLPYEDGLSLFVEKDGMKLSFRLQWRTESQAQIIDNFSNYVAKT
jgi:hypothetical protein